MRVLLGPTIHQISAAHAQLLTSRSFFPALISVPFENGLRQAFDFAAGACLVAALASWLSGERYVHEEPAAGAGVDRPEASGAARRRGPGWQRCAADETGLSSPVGVGGRPMRARARTGRSRTPGWRPSERWPRLSE